MADVQASIQQEIEDLHVFFVDWFTGAAPRSALDTVFAAATDPAFSIINPDGVSTTRAELMGIFEGAHGAAPTLRIAVRNVALLQVIDDFVLAGYEEWQTGSARGDTGRLSTVLMTRATPHRWLHVHETWLPEDVQASGPYDF